MSILKENTVDENELFPEKKILVISMNYIGDTLFSTPLIRALRRHYTEATIDVLVGRRGVAMLENNAHINSIITKDYLDKKVSFSDFARIIEKRKYDEVFIATTSFESALLAWKAKIPVRVGKASEGRDLLLTHVCRPKSPHIIHGMLSLLKPLNIADDGFQTEVFLTKEEEKQADAIFKENSLNKTKPLVIHTGATRKQKRLRYENFIKLITDFNEKIGAPIILVGGPDEDMINSIIAADCEKAAPVNLTNKISLRILCAVIKKAWAFVGGDSAPLHIASSMNVHTIGLFGGTSPRVYGTLHDGGRIISLRNQINPVIKIIADVKKQSEHPAMNAITSDMILSELESIYKWA